MAVEKWPYYWPVQIQDGAPVSLAYRTQEIQFGQGYGQNVADGPNAETKQFGLTFVGKTNEKWSNPQEAYNFLRQHFVVPFEFTTPDGETGLYVVQADSVRYSPTGRLTATVTATLKTAIGFV